MFCYNCGNQLDGTSRFCAKCGAPQNNTQPIKPIVSKVNNDDTLPKNGNMFITLLFLVVIVISCIIYLTNYKAKYDYTQYTTYEDYNIYLPLGFKYSYNEEKEGKELVIESDSMKFSFYTTPEDYNSYKKNDFKNVTSQMSQLGYTVSNVKEHTFNGNNIIIGELSKKSEDDKINYLYIYDTKDPDVLFYGYAISSGDFVDDHLEKLVEILSKVKHK